VWVVTPANKGYGAALLTHVRFYFISGVGFEPCLCRPGAPGVEAARAAQGPRGRRHGGPPFLRVPPSASAAAPPPRPFFLCAYYNKSQKGGSRRAMTHCLVSLAYSGERLRPLPPTGMCPKKWNELVRLGTQGHSSLHDEFHNPTPNCEAPGRSTRKACAQITAGMHAEGFANTAWDYIDTATELALRVHPQAPISFCTSPATRAGPFRSQGGGPVSTQSRSWGGGA
jgi:hypothetical protein